MSTPIPEQSNQRSAVSHQLPNSIQNGLTTDYTDIHGSRSFLSVAIRAIRLPAVALAKAGGQGPGGFFLRNLLIFAANTPAALLAGVGRTSRAVSARRSRLAKAAALCVGGLSLVTSALAAPVKFDIAPQSADLALQRFAQQASVEVAYPAAELRQVQSNALQGEFEPLAGLERLLSGSGYTPRQLSATSYAVARPPAPKPGSIDGSIRDESGKPVAGAKVALADSDQAVATDKRGRFSLINVPPGAHALQITADWLQNTRVTDITVKSGQQHSLSPITIPVRREGPLQLDDFVVSAKKNEWVVELDPYAIEGTRPPPFSRANLDLTRTRDDELPFVTFSSRDLELSGAANLQEFLQSRLAQNFSFDVPDEADGSGALLGAQSSRIDFRGWGTSETVILLNGRRMAAEYQGTLTDNSNATPTFAGIPVASIERVEVLPSAGSAIYGQGATGGVVNIITKQGYSGGTFAVSYETPTDANRPRLASELTYAFPLGRKTTLRGAISVEQQQPLTVADRADVTIQRWRSLVLERDPGRLVGLTLTSPPGATPNIRSVATTASTTLFPGGTANFTSVPPGYAGGSGLQPFLNRQGVYNLDLPEGATGSSLVGRDSTFGTEMRSYVIRIGVESVLSDLWRLSADLRHNRVVRAGQSSSDISFIGSTGAGNARVPAAAPTNPFGQDVRVRVVDFRLNRPELDNGSENETNTLSLTATRTSARWTLLADATFSHNTNYYKDEQFFEPNGGWQAAFLSGAYNPFVDVRARAPAADSFYANYIARRQFFSSASRTYQAMLKASGKIIEMPAGTLQVTGGGEWTRVDRYRSFSVAQYQNAVSGEPRIPTGLTSDIATSNLSLVRQFIFDTFAGYAEADVPLISQKQHVPLARTLNLFASGRLARELRQGFRSDGREIDYDNTPYLYAAGVRLSPAEGVTLRGSLSIGYRPPGISSITPSDPPTNTTTVIDRGRGNQAITLNPNQYLTGGNPDLDPETTESCNVGVIIRPAKLPGFRMAIDYLQERRDDFIASLSVQQAIDLESDIEGRVVRGASDGHFSGLGPITFVDARNINFQQVKSRSVDVTIEHEFNQVFGGRLLVAAAVSRNLSFKVQASIASLPVEQVGSNTASFSRQLTESRII